MVINEMSYNDIIKDYKGTLRSLIEDFKEENELRDSGSQGVMYFTSGELRFMLELLEQKEDEIDGRC